MELFTYLMAKNDHNTSVNKDLFSYLLGKNQSGTYTDYSGTSLSINNTKKGKMKVNLLGNTSQTGTPTPSSPIPVNVVSGDNTIVSTGKNLFDKDNETYTSGYITGSSATTLSPSSYNRTLYIHCQPNTTYTIQKMVSVSSSRFFIASSVDIPSAGVSIYNVLNGGDNNTSATYTTSNNAKYLLVNYMATNTTTTTVEEMLNSIQIEIGNQATTYEPYTSTSYPIHLGEHWLGWIGDYQDRFIKTTGKNLFDGIMELGIFDGDTGEPLPNSSYMRCKDFIPVEELTKYVITSIDFDAGFFVYEYKEDYSYNLTTNKSISNGETLTTNSGTKYLKFRPRVANTTLTSKFMVNKGETALPYEPYGTNEWYLEKKIEKRTLNGSENWTTWAASNVNTERFYCDFDTSGVSGDSTLCDKFIFSAGNGDTEHYRFSASTGYTFNEIVLFINKDRLDTVSATGLKKWLSNNNVILYRALDTPTYTQITGTLKDELEALQKAQSYKGTTNINQINNDLPFNMDVSVKVGN